MGKITQQPTARQAPSAQSYIQISALVKSVPVVEKDTSESLKERKWGLFAAGEFRTVQILDFMSAGFVLRQLQMRQEFRRV